MPLHSFLAACLGFAVAGMLATGYRAATGRHASFRLLGAGLPVALVALPLLVLAAPFIIARNTLRGRLIEGRHGAACAAGAAVAAAWSFGAGLVLSYVMAVALA